MRNPFRREPAPLPPEDKTEVPEEVHTRLARDQERARRRIIEAEAEIIRVRGKLSSGH